MKKIYQILFITLFLFSCNSASNQGIEKSDKTSETSVTAIKTIQLNVSGMTCEGCENSVETALTKLEGVKTAEASYVKKIASISYDSTKVSADLLTQTINDLGYHVEN